MGWLPEPQQKSCIRFQMRFDFMPHLEEEGRGAHRVVFLQKILSGERLECFVADR